MKYKNSKSGLVFDIFNYTFLAIMALMMIYPFYITFAMSISDTVEVYSIGRKLFPVHPVLDAYNKVLHSSFVYVGYRNTLLRTVINTCLSTFLTFSIGFALSKKDLPYRVGITLFFVFTMFFSGGLIPSYLVNKSLGLVDSFWVYILPGMYSVWNMTLMRNYIMSIPEELSDAALVDGASPVTIMWRIMLPVCVPIVATIALFNAVGNWNAWYDCQIYISSQSKMVLQMMVRKLVIQSKLQEMFPGINVEVGMKGAEYTTRSIEAATIMLAIGPIIIAYPFAQKYFVKGIMVGSLKG